MLIETFRVFLHGTTLRGLDYIWWPFLDCSDLLMMKSSILRYSKIQSNLKTKNIWVCSLLNDSLLLNKSYLRIYMYQKDLKGIYCFLHQASLIKSPSLLLVCILTEQALINMGTSIGQPLYSQILSYCLFLANERNDGTLQLEYDLPAKIPDLILDCLLDYK